MRNLTSSLMFIAFIYFMQTGFKWYYLILLFFGLFFIEWGVKENKEYTETLTEESKARIENIKWQTEISKIQAKINLRSMAIKERMREK